MDAQLVTSEIDMRDVFFDVLYDIARNDSNVLLLVADMGALSLNKFRKDLSSQYFNIGIAEQNLISLAAGLALSGKKVFTYAIAPFITQRCFEQIKIDLSCMSLPVTIIGVGAGIAYGSDGPTHHSMQDMAIIRTLPNMTIFNPSDPETARAVAEMAYGSTGPVYVRVDKGKFPLLYENKSDFSDGMTLVKEGCDVMIVTTGGMVHRALIVADELAKYSVDVGVIDVYRLKPIDEKLLLDVIESCNCAVTLEEQSIIGGLGSVVSEVLMDNQKFLLLKRIAIADEYCRGYGSREWMHRCYGLDVESITNTILSWYTSLDSSKVILTEKTVGKDQVELELTLEDFADFLGISVTDIPSECRELIDKTDFKYEILHGRERDKVLMDVCKKLGSDKQVIGTKERQDVWRDGWAENLESFLKSSNDLNTLVPKFIRPNQVIRLNQDYVKPSNPNFELDFFSVIRIWLFKKYLQEVESVYEFGCGTGFNLVALAQLYPDKILHGLDFVSPSRDMVNKIAQTYGWNMTGHVFDMRKPDQKFQIVKNSAVFTIGTIEQLASDFEPFLQFLLKRSPSLCFHVEPTIELYEEDNLVDYLAIAFHKKRGYTQGYLPRLRQLHDQGRIELIKVKRLFVGSLFMEGYNLIVWRPCNV